MSKIIASAVRDLQIETRCMATLSEDIAVVVTFFMSMHSMNLFHAYELINGLWTELLAVYVFFHHRTFRQKYHAVVFYCLMFYIEIDNCFLFVCFS